MNSEFIDIDRPISADYHSLMLNFNGEDVSQLQEKLEQMVEDYPDYLDPYNTLYAIYQNQEDFKSADTVLNRAYNRAHLLILDEKHNWPTKLAWEEPNNQHIIRTIFNKAIDFWMDENRADSLEVFDKLLALNPTDEIGAKFYHLAVKKRFTFEAFMKRFLKDGMLSDEIEAWYDKESAL